MGPDSCHDQVVKGAIVKGVGHRLRVNSSKNEYFEESVEETAKAFKISGYSYQETKKELLKFKDEDPLQLIKKKKTVRKKPNKGVRSFFISKYDPRMPHPRQLITKNYHHLASHPHLSNLFPRENLVGGTRRQPNLAEILSPSVQQSGQANHGDDGDDGDGGGGGNGGNRRWNGSYHCPLYKSKGRCDVCRHMVETSTIYSPYFKRKFAIHGNNVHLPASQKSKLRWFVYCVEDTACNLIYIGSTTDICKRWASTKKACLDGDSVGTGMYKHFKTGCPAGNGGGELPQLRWTILDHVETTLGKLTTAGHIGGPKCRCSECQRLKTVEDKWICRVGSFYGDSGLNTRDEVKARSRVNFVGQ